MANHYFFATTTTTDAWGAPISKMRCGCGWATCALDDIARVEAAFGVHVEGVHDRGEAWLGDPPLLLAA